MGLQKRTGRTNPDIPSTSSEPAKCRKTLGDTTCGADAHRWFSGTVNIMGKEVKIKIPFCDTHFEETRNASRS